MSVGYWHMMLGKWARWKVAYVRGEMGWPKTSPMFMVIPRSGSYGPHEAEFNDDAVFVDECVNRLDKKDRTILHEFYVIGGTAKEIAARLHICRRWLYANISRIHNELSGHGNEIAANNQEIAKTTGRN